MVFYFCGNYFRGWLARKVFPGQIMRNFTGPIGRHYALIMKKHLINVGGCIGTHNVYQYMELFWDVCERYDSPEVKLLTIDPIPLGGRIH